MEDRVITQQLRKVGNSYVVTVPKEEVERRGWQEGQLLALQLTELEVRPILGDDLREAIEERWERNEDALRYLAGAEPWLQLRYLSLAEVIAIHEKVLRGLGEARGRCAMKDCSSQR